MTAQPEAPVGDLAVGGVDIGVKQRPRGNVDERPTSALHK